MSLRTPSSKLRARKHTKIDLIPILDSVFIFIFFLLMSTQFVKVYEIGSNVPIISNTPPPKNLKKPLALTVRITDQGFTLLQGVPANVYKTIKKLPNGEYDFNSLHDHMIEMKKSHLDEETVVLEPTGDIDYDQIVRVMDACRTLKNTDESIYTKDKNGLDVKVKNLFHNIMFGNLTS